MTRAALALPALSPAVPLEMYIPGQNSLVVPLAIALLEANVITDAMLRPGPNATLIEVLGEPDEREVSMLALTKWWSSLVGAHPCQFFRWCLFVQKLTDHGNGTRNNDEMTAHFCLARLNSGDIPRFALARRTEQLEARLEGFGQTVLAVLFDATLLLPDSLNPWRAVDWVEWLHWSDSENDEELLESRRDEGGFETIAEVIENCDVLTRAEFYKNMPRWVVAPRRVASRKAIVRAAREGFETDVIAACDALASLVNSPDFVLRPWDKGSERCGYDSVDACMVLLWQESDVVSRVIDDALEIFSQGSDTTEYIDISPVQMTAEGVHEFQLHTKQMLQVAVLVERLVLLIGDPL